MSEAPKKIWIDEPDTLILKITEEDIPYIRADIVEELVKALEELVDLIDNDYEVDSLTTQPARAALAKLEENHD